MVPFSQLIFLAKYLPSSEKPKLWLGLCIILSLLVFYQTGSSWLSYVLFTALVISFTYLSIVYYFLTLDKLSRKKSQDSAFAIFVKLISAHIFISGNILFGFSLRIGSETINFLLVLPTLRITGHHQLVSWKKSGPVNFSLFVFYISFLHKLNRLSPKNVATKHSHFKKSTWKK